jgi:23S rRNA pseudouridine2605 synthase
MDETVGIRLQKVLASAGLGSRRACDELISAGRVQVNGQPAVPGQRVDPNVDVVTLDGDRIPTAAAQTYLALNKPRGMESSMASGHGTGRPTIGDLVGRLPEVRLFHVGRLDADSEGLLLLTNDGDLAHRLTHPSFAVPKTYQVEVAGDLPRRTLQALTKGVELADGPAAADAVRHVARIPGRSIAEVVLHDGRTHIVRRMFEAIGHPVVRLVRTQIGPLPLGALRPGAFRHLGRPEVLSLYRVADKKP